MLSPRGRSTSGVISPLRESGLVASATGMTSGRGMGLGRALAGLALLLTSLEFLLGMDVNLYTTCLPSDTRTLFASNPCPGSSQVGLEAHVVLGLLLVVVAIGLLAWGLSRRIPRVAGPAFGGLLGVVIAAVGGFEYLSTTNPAYSFLMAVGFLIAVGAYFQVLIGLRDLARQASTPVGWSAPAAANPPP